MNFLRKILFPLVPVYYLVTKIRNVLFDADILKSKTYNKPIICVGNLSTGGTGKTPMIEYLVRLLKSKYKLATLSRGYKRQSEGFILAEKDSKVVDIGDEPLQYASKFNDILVAVDSNRQNGIRNLLENKQNLDVILLDDAFQHRWVNPGLSILLTSYGDLYVDDYVLPTGNLREPRSGANRANIIVVTKCPENLEKNETQKIEEKLKIKNHQSLFFASILYDEFIYNQKSKIKLEDLKKVSFTLVTGIANPAPLVNHLNNLGLNFEHLPFRDHHKFTKKDIELFESKSMVLTTEKDFMRLKEKVQVDRIYFLPLKTKIEEEKSFDRLILDFITKF